MKFNKIASFSIVLLSILLLISVTQVIASSTYSIDQDAEIDSAINSGFEYLRTQMNDDGGIRWFDENSSAAASLRVVIALASAQYPQDFLISDAGNRPIDFLEERGESWVNQEDTENPGFSVGRAGQLLTAIAAANENPKAFGKNEANFISEINTLYDVNTGIYGGSTSENVTDQVWAMIGLAANNGAIPVEAADWLAAVQSEDGSWNDGFGSFLDTTPLGILALVGSGHRSIESAEILSANEFMSSNQTNEGGWQSEWDTVTNPNTTGVMVQAIDALGQFPDDEAWEKPGGNPLTALLSVQQDSGTFGGDFANAYSTADAITALSGKYMIDLGYLENASDGFDYIFANQDDSGGWGSVGQTLDIIMALDAAGWDPNSVSISDDSPLDYVAANLESYLSAGPDAIGKTILGVVKAGFDPANFHKTDLVQALQDTFDSETNAFGTPDNTWHQALAILGLHAAGEEIPSAAIEMLIALQQEDGGWEYLPGYGTWSDNTAMAVQALIAAGYSDDDEVINNAINYIKSMQFEDGGWGDSSTTAFVLMTLNALDEPTESWYSESKKVPLSNLFSFQKTNGAFLYTWEYPDDNLMSTASALFALFDGDYIIEPDNVSTINLASVFIIPDEGVVYADCVEFEEASISGLALLESSDFSYKSEEGFINSIMEVSNPEEETNYWSYWAWDGREWKFKNTGPGESIVLPGSVEAWYFTSWEVFPSLPPTFVPAEDQLCEIAFKKSYTDQPNLDYNDLFTVESEILEAPEPTTSEPVQEEIELPQEEPTAEETDASEPDQVTSPPIEEEQEEPLSRLPIFIIISVGIVLLGVVLFFVLRKRE